VERRRVELRGEDWGEEERRGKERGGEEN